MSEKKKFPPTQPSFVGKKVHLRPLTPDDAMSAQHWFNLSEPQSMASLPLPLRSPAEAAELAKKAEQSTDRQRLAIVRTEDNVLVGRITFFNYNSLNRSAELGVLIDPEERKNGYAAEALRILIRYLFKYRGLNKVYAETAAHNHPTRKLLESLNFKQEGVLRQHYFYNGQFHDKLVYSLLLFESDL
ncbi:MAG TPA: GNAT family protein [candidate division Zixibacteria bacterium]|nr:GNAT family protein [candidate division Zixibacteria bacterium]